MTEQKKPEWLNLKPSGMRFTASEKHEIIKLVEGSDLPAKMTLDQLGIPKSTFYDWYARYREKGYEGLLPQKDPVMCRET